jgi:hypothetical protein
MTRPGWRLVAAGLALSACQPPADTARTKETAMPQEIPPPNPFEGIFPPAWKVGTRWRASMKTQSRGIPVMGPVTGPVYDEIELAFRVIDAPGGDDGVFRIDVQSKAGGPRIHYVASYRARPFSFVRLEDEAGKSISRMDETNPPIPYIGGDWGGFIKDFPAMPTIPRAGLVPFLFDKEPAAQDTERTAEGLRFTLTRTNLRAVIHWKRGAPWWSSIEETVNMPPLPPQLVASGKLLDP